MRPNVRGVSSVRFGVEPRVRSGAPLSARPRTRLPLAAFALVRPPSSPASGAGAPLAPYLVSAVSLVGSGWLRVAGRRLACRLSRHHLPPLALGGRPSAARPPALSPCSSASPLLPRDDVAPTHSYHRAGAIFVHIRCNPPLSITAVEITYK